MKNLKIKKKLKYNRPTHSRYNSMQMDKSSSAVFPLDQHKPFIRVTRPKKRITIKKNDLTKETKIFKKAVKRKKAKPILDNRSQTPVPGLMKLTKKLSKEKILKKHRAKLQNSSRETIQNFESEIEDLKNRTKTLEFENKRLNSIIKRLVLEKHNHDKANI